MAKADVVAAGVQAIQSAEAQALADQLGIAFDAGAASAPPAVGFTQADIDAAVASALTGERSRIASALAPVFQKEESDILAAVSPSA